MIKSVCVLLLVLSFTTLALSLAHEEASHDNSYDDDPAMVVTQFGPVRGAIDQGFRVFKGIPFASQERFKAPTPASKWGPSVLNATEFGPECPQNDNHAYMSEDCLSLNIWTPLPGSEPFRKNPLLPVLVWIYGGAFISGSSAIPIYSGDFYANSSGVIMVSINYRVGAFGFMISEEMGLTGNYGFLDQQAALAWVQANIKDFGGDPSQVTIFGQSAGGMSVTYHIVSPSSAPLFQRAIIESNPFGVFLRSPEECKPTVNNFLILIGCDGRDGKKTLECLNSKNISEIVKVEGDAIDPRISITRSQYYLPWQPTVDGVLIPDQPLNMILNGDFNKVPIVIGTTKNETTAWTFGHVVELIPVDMLDYEVFIKAEFLEHSTRILQLYPPPPISFRSNDEARVVLSNLLTDFLFLCPMKLATENLFKYLEGTANVYQYFFLHDPLTDPSNSASVCNFFGAACHSAELTSVFNSVPLVLNDNQYTPAELELALSMLNYWSSFAIDATTSNNPLGRDDPEWPAFTTGANSSISLNIPITAFSNYRQEKCDYWNSLPYFYQHGFK